MQNHKILNTKRFKKSILLKYITIDGKYKYYP